MLDFIDDVMDFMDDHPINKGVALSAVGMIFSGLAGIISLVNSSYTQNEADKAMKSAVKEEVAKAMGRYQK